MARGLALPGDHRCGSFVDGVDDFGVVDPAQVGGCDAEVGVAELALDDYDRHAFCFGELKKHAPASAFGDLHTAWILDGASVAAGVLTLMALTGHLGRGRPSADSIYAGNVRVFYTVQFATFVAALVFTIKFGIRAA